MSPFGPDMATTLVFDSAPVIIANPPPVVKK